MKRRLARLAIAALAVLAPRARQAKTSFAAEPSQKTIPGRFILNSRRIAKSIRHVDGIIGSNPIPTEAWVIFGEFPGVFAGAIVMPGRNLSVGLRWKP